MNSLITAINILILSNTFLIADAEIGTLEKSPIDGIIEITQKSDDGAIDRHFINGAQVARVFSRAYRAETEVVISTTEVEVGGTPDHPGVRSLVYVLRYKAAQDAKDAVNQIVAEVRSALGHKSAATSGLLKPELDNSHDEAEPPGAGQPATPAAVRVPEKDQPSAKN